MPLSSYKIYTQCGKNFTLKTLRHSFEKFQVLQTFRKIQILDQNILITENLILCKIIFRTLFNNLKISLKLINQYHFNQSNKIMKTNSSSSSRPHHKCHYIINNIVIIIIILLYHLVNIIILISVYFHINIVILMSIYHYHLNICISSYPHHRLNIYVPLYPHHHFDIHILLY